MNFLRKIIDVKAWKHATKTAAIIVMAAVALLTALAVINVSEEEMMRNASQEMEQAIQTDQTNTRKRVTVTYNSFGLHQIPVAVHFGRQRHKGSLHRVCGYGIQRG